MTLSHLKKHRILNSRIFTGTEKRVEDSKRLIKAQNETVLREILNIKNEMNKF